MATNARKEAPFRVYRGHLPHWREATATYFVTWRSIRGTQGLTTSERTLVADALHHRSGKLYDLYAFVVMNDHVHVLLSPLDGRSLESVVQSRKSYTSHIIQQLRARKGELWQREYFDRIVRDEKEFEQKRDYILRNPFKRWPDLESYQWVWAQSEY